MPVDTHRVNGAAGGYMQPARWGYSESGDYQIQRWEGTRAEVIQNIGALPPGSLYEVTESFTGAKTVLEARIPVAAGGEVPAVIWELVDGTVEKDLLEWDKAEIAAITEDDRRKIRDAIANPTPGSSPALTDTDAITVYQHMLAGVRSAMVEAPVLRKSMLVSAGYSTAVARTNVGRLISTAQMVTTEGCPADFLIELPDVTSTRTDINLEAAWFKKGVALRTAGRYRRQVETEYVYGLWSTFLYGAVIVSGAPSSTER